MYEDSKLHKYMSVLQPSEYDISYFDPQLTSMRHNAGYSLGYKKWPRINDDFVPHAESTGEFYGDLGKYLVQRFNLAGKKILDVGCAKGFVVEGLRNAGADAWGIDVSEYAVNAAELVVRPFLIIGDARDALSQFANNEFDILFSRWTLSCFSDTDLPALIAQMNRVARLQVHLIWEDFMPNFYNAKPLADWRAMGFKKGTILIPKNRMNNFLTK